jgi:hypothetical protein
MAKQILKSYCKKMEGYRDIRNKIL